MTKETTKAMKTNGEVYYRDGIPLNIENGVHTNPTWDKTKRKPRNYKATVEVTYCEEDNSRFQQTSTMNSYTTENWEGEEQTYYRDFSSSWCFNSIKEYTGWCSCNGYEGCL
ncbi:MAG: hypothetical protein GY928_30810, partial [Colwellia sp.]|nr:hypothetical protein [Colwellia sp.]